MRLVSNEAQYWGLSLCTVRSVKNSGRNLLNHPKITQNSTHLQTLANASKPAEIGAGAALGHQKYIALRKYAGNETWNKFCSKRSRDSG